MNTQRTDTQQIETQNGSDRQEREALQTDIEFIGDFDIVVASGVDLSDGGICFELAEGLPFEMRFSLDGTAHQKRAQLIWVKRLEGGQYRFGFTFLPSEPYPVV